MKLREKIKKIINYFSYNPGDIDDDTEKCLDQLEKLIKQEKAKAIKDYKKSLERKSEFPRSHVVESRKERDKLELLAMELKSEEERIIV